MTGEASNSSCGVSPATGQPQTPRTLSMPVCLLCRPTSASRRQISGTSPSVNQRSWICCRVVRSQKPLPYSSDRSAMTRNWRALVLPASSRRRSMKLPGVGVRKNRPCHLARCLSSSVISCPVVGGGQAAECRAGSRGRPSPALMISILFFSAVLPLPAGAVDVDELAEQRLAGAAAGAGACTRRGAEWCTCPSRMAATIVPLETVLQLQICVSSARLFRSRPGAFGEQGIAGVAPAQAGRWPGREAASRFLNSRWSRPPGSGSPSRIGADQLVVADHELLVDALGGIEVADHLAVGTACRWFRPSRRGRCP